MAAEQDIIREFLVSLGFKVDKSGLESFVKGMAAASSAVIASVGVIEDNLERLFFASQRTKASAENIRALGFSLSQLGSSAGAATEAVESLARFMRNSPGSAAFLKGLGVATQDANGQMRDTVEILRDLGAQLARMPYYRANAYAQFLGIDEKTLMALREGLGQFGDEYSEMLAKAGLNLEDATKKSHDFMVESRTLGSAIAILGQKISSTLSASLIGTVRRFREGLVDNFGSISLVIERVIKVVSWVADAISTMAIRAAQAAQTVADWFNSFDDGTKKVILAIGGLAAAWYLFDKIFMSTPLGRLTAFATALGLLYDDYKTWKEGGKSLLNWQVWEDEIDKALFGLQKLGRALRSFGKMAQDVWRGNWSALPDDWREVQSALAAKDAGGGNSQADIDAYKTGGGVKLTPDAQRRLAGIGGFVEDGSIVEMPPASAPRGIRNNNPGNIEFAHQPGATLETRTTAPKRFAQFRTPEEGLAALAIQLRRYGSRGIDTLNSIIGTYAPKWENNTAAYVARLAKDMGVRPDARLDLNDSGTMQQLMGGIIRFENANQNPYSTEMIRAASGATAAGVPGTAPVINQTNNINVTGHGAPAVARSIGSEMDSVNQRMVRNLRPITQ